jgi:L-threonylcarbamoyladenylate synthase
VSLTPKDATLMEKRLARDGVAVVPTDTVYGLACHPESATAMRRIYELKRRPPVKPAAVMFFALDAALDALTPLGSRTSAALTSLLPGPVTVLLANPRRRFPLACDPAGSSAKGPGRPMPLGLRVPKLDGSLAALAGVRTPVLQSSANLSGEPPPRRLADVPVELREGADIVLDGGELPGVASTVIDLSGYERSGELRIVRDGPLTRAAVERLLG